MKKDLLFFILISLATIANSFAQENEFGVNINLLHSSEGRKWARHIGDRDKIDASLEDDVLIFYSDGKLGYDEGDLATPALKNISTKTWSYNNETNILSWEIYLPNNIVKKYKASINVLHPDRLVLFLSEGDSDAKITVYKPL